MAEAEERRILAEERLADLQLSLAGARQRSINAQQLGSAIEQRIGRPEAGPITIDDRDMLDALHRALNATVDAIGPTMHLYNVVDMVRRAA